MLDRIWRDNYRLLRGIAARIQRDSTRVDDILQESYLRILEQRKQEPLGLAYARAVVRNTAIEHHRRRLRQPQFLEDPIPPPTPYELLLRREEAHYRTLVIRRTRSLTNLLPENQRRALYLVFCRDGTTLTEVCADTGESTSTVWSRMRMALKEIRRDLVDCGLWDEYRRVRGHECFGSPDSN